MAVHQAPLNSTIFRSLLKFMSVELVMPSNYLLLCHPLLLLPSTFPASGSFPVSWLFTSGGQSIGASASASVLSMNIEDWFPLELTGWISLQSKGLSRGSWDSQGTLQHHNSKASILQRSPFFTVQLSYPYMTPGNTIALTVWTFVDKVMSLLFNMLSRFVVAFLERSKSLLMSWLQSPSMVILEPKKIKCHCFHFSPCYFQIKCLYSIYFYWFFLLVNQSFWSPVLSC